MTVDLRGSTAEDRVLCFGEAFRDVRMVKFETCAIGQMMTTVILDGQTVLLVGDPEDALAAYYEPFHPGQRYQCDGGGTVAYSRALHERAVQYLDSLAPRTLQ